jgi:hypothetical protein
MQHEFDMSRPAALLARMISSIESRFLPFGRSH